MDSLKKYKRLVVITSRFPFPLEKGDKLRAYYQIKELAQHFEIYLISTSEKKVTSEQIMELQPYCKEIHCFAINGLQKLWGSGWSLLGKLPIQVGYFHHYSIQKKVNKILERIAPNHIYCQLIRSAEYVKNYHTCSKTIDYMDALSKGMERRSTTSKFPFKQIFNTEYHRLLDYENSIFEYFEHHTIISKQDRDYIYHKNRERIQVVLNGVHPKFLKNQNSENPIGIATDIVFIGNMSYSPNIKAAEFLVKEIFPNLPDNVTIKIAGAAPSREVQNLASKNVQITGFIPDIMKAYQSAKIFVAPMFIGTGLQNKLLEAMALGIPCITTSLANNALGAMPEKEILIADNIAEFSKQIKRLLVETEDRKEIGKNGQTFIQKKYKWSEVTLPLIKLIKE